jgi:hypothetical protein
LSIQNIYFILAILWILVLPEIFSIDWSVAETKNEGFIFRDIHVGHFFVPDTTFPKLSALSNQPVSYTTVFYVRTHTLQELVSGYAADEITKPEDFLVLKLL